jgi:hypothetical protein
MTGRRRLFWLLGVPVAGLTALATVPLASAGPTARTGPYGRFGFVTVGLGATPAYGEPSLAVARDGRHLVISTPGSDANGNGTVQYWYTSNDGRSWAHSESTSTNGGGDSYVDFLPNGTLLSADLAVTNANVQTSHNFGKTWGQNSSVGIEQDRMWLAHSPNGRIEYLVYHDFAAEAEFYAKGSWNPTTRTFAWASPGANPINSPDQVGPPAAVSNPTPGQSPSLLDQGVNTFSGPMLVDNDGHDLYVVYSISDLQSNADPQDGVPPFGPTRGIVVAHSADGGATWTNHYADIAVQNPANPSAESTEGAIFPWGSIGPDGTVYVVFNSTRGTNGSRYHQYYTYSTDKGVHWSRPVKLDTLPLNRGSAVYATSAAGGPGVLDVAWYQTANGEPSSDASVWVPYFAQITAANTRHPHVVTQAVTTIPNHKGGICLQGILCGIGPGSSDRSLLDFFQVVVNPRTGMAELAYADNNRLGKTASGSKRGEVVFAQQTSGPSAFARSPRHRVAHGAAGLGGLPISTSRDVLWSAAVLGTLVALRRRRTAVRLA